MGIFDRKRSHLTSTKSSSPSSAEPHYEEDVDALQYNWSAKRDPGVVDNVRAEWNMSDPDYSDPRAWGNGMNLFETGPPGQRFNSAEYMSRGFCNVLFEPDFMGDADVAVTIERMLMVFDTSKIAADIYAEIAAKRIRLALTVMRQRGWQPTPLGGNGRINLNLDTPRIRASLSFDGISADKSLENFFGLT